MQPPRETVIHPSLNRPHLLMGAPRAAVMSSAACCAFVEYIMFMKWWVPGMIGSVVLWVAILWVLRECAASDPLLLRIVRRYTWYDEFYPAQSPLLANPQRVDGKWSR